MKITAIAFASALFFSQLTLATAQTTGGSPGTAGAGNAAATSGSAGIAAPTQQGAAAGPTNPGNTNVAPADPPPPPATTTGQAPSGGTVQSTVPPTPPGTSASGSTVGQSTRATRLQDPKEDPVVRETEQEVSRRIKSICRGC
jgi:hypothetical protein